MTNEEREHQYAELAQLETQLLEELDQDLDLTLNRPERPPEFTMATDYLKFDFTDKELFWTTPINVELRIVRGNIKVELTNGSSGSAYNEADPIEVALAKADLYNLAATLMNDIQTRPRFYIEMIENYEALLKQGNQLAKS